MKISINSHIIFPFLMKVLDCVTVVWFNKRESVVSETAQKEIWSTDHRAW